jgi:hypothetical protein
MGVPRKLFDANILTYGTLATSYDVTKDGQRFLINLATVGADSLIGNRPIRVVLNWTTPSKP